MDAINLANILFILACLLLPWCTIAVIFQLTQAIVRRTSYNGTALGLALCGSFAYIMAYIFIW